MLRRTALPALGLVVAGCSLIGPPATGPDGLSSYDGELRSLTASGRYETALEVAEADAGDAGDDLLAELNRAVIEYYAGRHVESNARLQAVDLEIEDRFTKSVSRAALSLVTSDRALAWLPSTSERLMIHVYGALNYLALGEADEAAVEARRLAMLLDRMVEDDGVDGLDAEARQLHRTLRYFTAALFDQAGEANDADVAFRLAGMDRDEDGFRSLSTGSVVVLVESGFVAHRVEQSILLPVGGDVIDPLRYGSDADRMRHARCFSHDRFRRTLETWGDTWDGEGCRDVYGRDRADRDRYDGRNRSRSTKDDRSDVVYLMRVSWPTMYRPPGAAPLGEVRGFTAASAPAPRLEAARDATALDPRAGGGGVSAAPGTGTAPVVAADLSGAVIRDFNRKAPGILFKSVARAALKYATVQAVEDGLRDEDDTLADIAAVVGNVVAAVTERADTRAWAMLPAQLHVVRMDLEPGTHDVVVTGSGGRRLDVGDVEVRPGRVSVVSVRAWP